jgi:DNA-binding transcriptional ArsR family regulator
MGHTKSSSTNPTTRSEVQKKWARGRARLDQAKRVSSVLQTASDPTRLQILLSLSDGEQSVQTLVSEVGQSQSAISHHLALLRHTRLIEPRRDGARYYYSLTGVGQELAGLLQTLMPPRPVLTRAAKARAEIGAVRRKDGGKTMHKFRRLTPASTPSMIKSGNCWVIVLSDWSPGPDQGLIERVQTIFGRPDQQALLPTVLIVDDVGSPQANHEMLLSDLTEVGGIVLLPHSQEEIEAIRRDPVAFAAAQLAAMQAHPVGTSAPSASAPSSPDAYKEFAKAVTRLSPGELRDVIAGHRTDDWRYST